MRRLALIVLVLPTLLFAEGRPTLQLPDTATQGALIEGWVPPGSVVRHDGRRVRVTEGGRFLIGLDRDAPKRVTVTARLSDGSREQASVRVRQRDYAIQRIDGLPPKKVTPDPEVIDRIRAEAARVRAARARNDARRDFLSGWQWPAIGPITGVYGSQRVLNGEPRRPHYGVDVALPVGSPVVAPAHGVVTLVESDLYFSGGTLIVDHGHGLSSTFLHLSRITVKPGERVRRGEKIAEIGATGRVTGAHLDWRMNWFDRRIDPTLLVGAMPAE